MVEVVRVEPTWALCENRWAAHDPFGLSRKTPLTGDRFDHFLDIPLQRVVHLPKTSRHRDVRNLEALALQFVSHRSCRLVRPLQVTHRISRRRLVNNPSQRSLYGWIGFLDP